MKISEVLDVEFLFINEGNEWDILKTQSKEDIDNIGEEKVVSALMPLIKNMARKYQNSSATYDELVSEGMTSVSQAINNFKGESGASFSSYAYNWIKSAIQRFASKSPVVDMPYTEDGKLVQNNADNIEHLNNKNPESKEFVIDDEKPEPLNTKALVIKALNRAFKLGDIDEKEFLITKLLFGIGVKDDKGPMSPQDVSKIIGVSMARISQIKTKALKAIKDLYGSIENLKQMHESLYKEIRKILV